jgi:hypothetical protein
MKVVHTDYENERTLIVEYDEIPKIEELESRCATACAPNCPRCGGQGWFWDAEGIPIVCL